MNNARKTEAVDADSAIEFDLSNFLPHRLAILSRLTQVMLASVLGASGLTIAQWRVYLCLVEQGPSTLNSIAEFTQLPQSSLSRSVARMAERNLVRNLRNEDDRRLSHIEITAEGRAQLNQAIRAIEDDWANVFATAPVDEQKFLRTVNKLIDHLATQPERD